MMRTITLGILLAGCADVEPVRRDEDSSLALRRIADLGGMYFGAVVADGGRTVFTATDGVTARWRVDLQGFDRAQDVRWGDDGVGGRDGAPFALGTDRLYALPDAPLDPEAPVQRRPGTGEDLTLPELGPVTEVPTENDRQPLGAWSTARGTVSLQQARTPSRWVVEWHDLDVSHTVDGDLFFLTSVIDVDPVTARVLLVGHGLWSLAPDEAPVALGDATLVTRDPATDTILTWDGQALVATDGPRRLLWRRTPELPGVTALSRWEEHGAFLVWTTAGYGGPDELLVVETTTGEILASVETASGTFPSPGVQALGDTVVVSTRNHLEVFVRPDPPP